MKVFMTSVFVLRVRYRRSWNLHTRLKTSSTVVSGQHLRSDLDIIYSVSGPNKHSQDALN